MIRNFFLFIFVSRFLFIIIIMNYIVTKLFVKLSPSFRQDGGQNVIIN